MIENEIRNRQGQFNKVAIDLATETEAFVTKMVTAYGDSLSVDAIMNVIVLTTVLSCGMKIAMGAESDEQN